jgi:hypothetical protein
VLLLFYSFIHLILQELDLLLILVKVLNKDNSMVLLTVLVKSLNLMVQKVYIKVSQYQFWVSSSTELATSVVMIQVKKLFLVTQATLLLNSHMLNALPLSLVSYLTHLTLLEEDL